MDSGQLKINHLLIPVASACAFCARHYLSPRAPAPTHKGKAIVVQGMHVMLCCAIVCVNRAAVTN